MKIEGKVSTKTENSEGHSQVRVSCAVTIGDAKPVAAELIISTASLELIGQFAVGQAVSFTL